MSQTVPAIATAFAQGPGEACRMIPAFSFEGSAPEPRFVGRLESALALAESTGEIVAAYTLCLEPSADRAEPVELFLLEAARRIDHLLRLCDTALYIGGGCFTLVQTALTGRTGAILRARSLLNYLMEPFVVRGRSSQLTVRVGLCIHSRGMDSQMLLQGAGEALNKARCSETDLVIATGHHAR